MSNTFAVARGGSPGALFARVWGVVRRVVGNAAVALVAMAITASAANADTLLMPDRDFLMGASEVVWGVTTQANGTPFSINFGDGSAAVAGNVADRSFISFNHTYAVSGTFTVSLTVGAESATTTVRVFNGALLSATDLRGLNINRAIQDGLRWLWTAQENRAANFPSGTTTNWGHLFSGWRRSFTALVVLAFENHGYKVPNNDTAPTGLYERFIVQRGLNYIVDTLNLQTLTVQPAGDPCVGGVEAAPCQGLYNADQPGYSTAVSSLALAGSSALSRHIPAGLGSANGNYVAGKTIGDILQRLMNTVAWGQNDAGCVGRGGWIYGFSGGFCQQSDGSTVGWDILALLDAAAAGVAEPAFVKSEFAIALAQGGNTSGSLDYRADNNPATDSTGNNVARAGTYLSSLFYEGVIGVADPRVAAARDYINSRWSGAYQAGDYTGTCSGTQNKGCAYGMYNAFKGLKLQGITTLPAIGDWYADYQDWLVANQSSDGSWTGGAGKTAMQFSCCANDQSANAAIAELILAPVALIAPDPTLFATVGLSPATATNLVGTDHTVTAFAQAANGAPVPGVTVDFRVLTGPNTGKTGTGTTGADGKVSFTYHDDGGAGTDTIQAFIGTLGSNVVSKIWTTNAVCDVDKDGDIDKTDLSLISKARGQPVLPGFDPRDANGDGKIDAADVKVCTLKCTRANCAIN